MTIKKAIAIGLLSSAVITLTAFSIKNKTRNKTTTPNANKQAIRVNAEEILTDLTNTTWLFNETIVKENYWHRFNINFTSNNTYYTKLIFQNDDGTDYTQYISYSRPFTTVYLTTWTNTAYRTIHIEDGEDVTNTQLIDILYTYSTIQITPTNLTNTSWKINNTLPNITAGQGNYSINFFNNGNSYSKLYLGYDHSTTATANYISYDSYEIYKNSQWEWTNSDQTYTQSSKIIITGGTDATNINLIVWLTQNATQYNEITTTLNTKWQFIDNPKSNYSNFEFNINFSSNNKTCNKVVAGKTTKNMIAYAYKTDNTTPYTLNQIYDGTNWANNKFKTIIIAGGNDVENISLISWITANATGTSYTPIPTDPNDYDIENGNFVSLQSLMIQILTMPFTFISQAFNITLWPNTAWEFNISNFILALIAIGAILFIIKLFTSGFSVITNYTHNINTEAKIRSDNRKSKQAWKSQRIAEKEAKKTNNE